MVSSFHYVRVTDLATLGTLLASVTRIRVRGAEVQYWNSV